MKEDELCECIKCVNTVYAILGTNVTGVGRAQKLFIWVDEVTFGTTVACLGLCQKYGLRFMDFKEWTS